MEDREPPPPYFGDYPHGAYWSALAPEGATFSDDEEDFVVEGSELRVMWDEGGPLWGEDGLLPDEPEWLRRALALSDSLVIDLLAWLSDMTTLQGSATAASRERAQELVERGRELAERLQREVGSQYRVWYHA